MTPADLSVVIPNYNHARFLPRALDAILAQSLPPREVIVLDDASTDDSVSVIERYARKQPAVRLVRHERNLGVVAGLNRGTELATSTYLHLAAADDYVLPGFYEKAFAQLARHPEAGLCWAYDSCQHGEDGPLDPNPSGWPDRPGYYTPDDVCRLLRHTIPGHPSIVRRDLLLAQGGFAPDLKWYCDWFALLTVAFRRGVCHVPEMLSIRVLMPGNYSAAARPGEQNVAILGRFLDHITAPAFADVAPYFRRNGAATFFGTDLVRAAAARPDRWHPDVLGFLNGFTPDQYAELLTDPDPAVRELAGFFLGPFWREAAEKRTQKENEIVLLRDELERTRAKVPPTGAVGKLRWLGGLVRKRLWPVGQRSG